jgi:hypothetical protein
MFLSFPGCILTYFTWVYFYILAFLFLSQFTANSQYIHNTYTNVRRPPLPDYQSATHMAQVARQRHKQWAGSNKYYREEDFDHTQGMCQLFETMLSVCSKYTNNYLPF